MKKYALLPLLICANAYAGNYISVQAVQSTISDTCAPMEDIVFDHSDELMAAGYNTITTTCNESDWGGRFAFGEQFSNHWGLELGYQKSGEVLLEVEGDGEHIADFSLPMTAFDVAVTYRMELLFGIQLTGRLGAARWNIEFEHDLPLSLPEIEEIDQSGTTAQYGIGAEWSWITVGYNVITDVGFEDEEDKRDVKQVMVGGKFKF